MKNSQSDKALKIVEVTGHHICNHCLGRIFSNEVLGDSNPERGQKIRENISLKSSEDECPICDGIFVKLDSYVNRIIRKTQDEDIEFNTFLVGCRVPKELIDQEKGLQEVMGAEFESIKKEINREIGKKLEEKWEREVEFTTPQLVIMVDIPKDQITFQINPLFIEGRYRKLVRGIPQTKWPCRKCKGKGCEYCNNSGKMYPESVEELISPPVTKATRGVDSKFHGAGREDIDVRMLGNGRPFVIEIKEPKIRTLDLKSLENEINQFAQGKVEVLDLKPAAKERKGSIKNSSTQTYKTYLALVELEEAVKDEDIEVLHSLKKIAQRTPLRVSHRRADKIREREVRGIKINKINSKSLELVIECEGGLYIKELISGDEGRTKPSVSSLLNMAAQCVALDVLEVNI